MIDRFGILPEPTKHLFADRRTKQRAAAWACASSNWAPTGGRILFKAKPNVDPLTVIRLVQRQPKVYAFDGQDKVRVKLELPGAAERLRTAGEILTALGRPPG